MTERGELTVLMITHKFREVTAFADDVTVLRRGRLAGTGQVAELSLDAMAAMMIGDTSIRERAAAQADDARAARGARDRRPSSRDNDEGLPAVDAVNLKVHAGEIVGIAGVSGNGQAELVEVLAGQREPTQRAHLHPRQALRADARRAWTAARSSACPRSR